MSLEKVKSFYGRLASDEFFCTQVQNAQSQDECSQIVKCAGYNFTQAEFEEYTGQLLEALADSEFQELDEQQLEAVVGGAISGLLINRLPKIYPNDFISKKIKELSLIFQPPVQALYGSVERGIF